MRRYRIALFVGWLVVSSLAVVGFAAFTAGSDSDNPELEVPTVSVSPEIGRSAGAVAAMTFALLADGANPADASDFAGNLSALVGDEATTTSGVTATSGSAGGVVDRSQFFDESQIRALVKAHFAPEDVSRAIRIAWCESSFNPRNVNAVTGEAGLFQHDPGTWTARATAAGVPGADILEADASVAVAAWMLYELPGGWSHWQCQA